jgi:hypothetical protein
MQTPSHFLLTTMLGRQITQRDIPVHTGALLIGSILPDIPFTALTLGGEIYYRWFAVLPASGSIMEYLHLTLFFTNPMWIISHNIFHSLVVNICLLGLGYSGLCYRKRWGFPLVWLAVSMAFHTVIDIFTHHSDGPLLFFPLHWSYRFASPVSYWEPRYYGQIFMTGEYILDAVILGYLGWQWVRQRHQRKAR